MTETPPKVYIHGAVCRGQDIERLFEKVGVRNPLEYKFGDPADIYFVNQKGEIAVAEYGSDLHYVIESSVDWKELKLRQPKKERQFLITIKEGSSSCNGCSVLNKCTETQKAKCQIAKGLKTVIGDNDFTGLALDVEEIKKDCYYKFP